MKLAMEHSSEEDLKEYLKEHPKADPKNHKVNKNHTVNKSKTIDAKEAIKNLKSIIKSVHSSGEDEYSSLITKATKVLDNVDVTYLSSLGLDDIIGETKPLFRDRSLTDKQKRELKDSIRKLEDNHARVHREMYKNASITTPKDLLSELSRIQKLAAVGTPSRKVIAQELNTLADSLSKSAKDDAEEDERDLPKKDRNKKATIDLAKIAKCKAISKNIMLAYKQAHAHLLLGDVASAFLEYGSVVAGISNSLHIIGIDYIKTRSVANTLIEFEGKEIMANDQQLNKCVLASRKIFLAIRTAYGSLQSDDVSGALYSYSKVVEEIANIMHVLNINNAKAKQLSTDIVSYSTWVA